MSDRGLNIQFDASEFEKLGQGFTLHKFEVQTAIRNAVRTTTQRLRYETRTEFVRVSGLKVSIVRRRMFLRYRYADGYGRVWFGLNPISLSKLSPRRTASGVRAGPVSVPGGFMPAGRYGRTVFARKGDARLPIEKQRYEIRDIGEEVIRTKVEPIVETIFLEEFREELMGAISGETRTARRSNAKFRRE